jgi:hypothetical protein
VAIIITTYQFLVLHHYNLVKAAEQYIFICIGKNWPLTSILIIYNLSIPFAYKKSKIWGFGKKKSKAAIVDKKLSIIFTVCINSRFYNKH